MTFQCNRILIKIKIFGAGKLIKPEQKDASLKFVLGSDLVDAITVGMLSTSEVDDTFQRIGSVSRV